VEWPERGVGVLPPADLEVEIEFGVQVRYISLSAKSATAQPIVAALRAQLADRR
jgi:tRNA threonylcarbamoyladenosine biosynthesis protein TsaE